ncbi:MAG: hypothetical protein HC897_08975 [Thermoanaerobaculia bacterium]|nr:hypothetical protein [Thermoanaerobaculia bacterium]
MIGSVAKVCVHPFDRHREHCKPGDHRFVLERDHTAVELTATLRTGWHRYHFARTQKRSISIDLAGPLGPCEMEGVSFGRSMLADSKPRW